MYLVSMAQNTDESECGDYYCDANSVCGVRCSEIDIQEGNKWSWHSTLHDAEDGNGAVSGYGGGGDGWSGPRDFTSEEYGPAARTIDTNSPFQVSVSFPTDGSGQLSAMNMVLEQEGRTLNFGVDSYDFNGNGMTELTASLMAGMTPTFSYWCASDMTWMDGAGSDGLGPSCYAPEDGSKCGDTVSFYDFEISSS